MPKNALVESISTRICDKKASITAAQCFDEKKGVGSICAERCRIEEKSLSQLEYVKSSINENIYLNACPGSGKTEVVALKTAFELIKWNQLGGIAVLSFTQNAASLINDRVREFIGASRIGHPHFIGTIDSWLHSYIAHPFSYKATKYKGVDKDKSIRLVDSSSDAVFLSGFARKYSFAKTRNIRAHEYFWDAEKKSPVFSSYNRKIDEARKKEFNVIEKWKRNNLIKELFSLKLKFWTAGFATYQDIEYLCHFLISKSKELRNLLSKRFPLIVVDECQDLSRIQLEILGYLQNSGLKLHFVGDVNQAIYEFKDVDPTNVLKFADDKKFNIQNLDINYRSNQDIINLSQKIVAGTKVNAAKKVKFTNSCICINYKKESIHNLAPWFESYLKDRDIQIERSSIVARGWSTVRKLRPGGNNSRKKIQEKVATAFYLWCSGNKDGRKEALLYMGEFIYSRFFSKHNVSRKKYFCPEEITSLLKWRLFLSRVLDECNDTQWNISDLSVSWTIWAKNIRSCIHDILNKHQLLLTEFSEVFTPCKFPAIQKKGNEKVIDTIKDGFVGKNSNLRITTIHQVKGETLDAIMVVSSVDKRGSTKDGHWTFWLEDPNSEKARLAYVASSRPKHLLVWAVPEVSEGEKQQLIDLGFHIEDLSD